MILKGGYYYSLQIRKDRDIPPRGHPLFLLSAGHSKPITKECIDTEHPPRKDYQILYVHSGAIRYLDNSNVIHIAPKGSFLIFKPLERQKYQFLLSDEPDVYWCHFAGPFAETVLKNYKLYDKRVIQLTSDTKYRRLYTAMRVALENKEKYYIELASLYLQELIVTIGSEMEKKHSKDDIPENIKNLLAYIHEHYFEDLTVIKLAKIAMTNKISLTRQFEKHLNCSPKKYLNTFRINKAKTLLLQTNYKISEIALSVGYQDPLYFSTVFRAETNMSPREYRSQNNPTKKSDSSENEIESNP